MSENKSTNLSTKHLKNTKLVPVQFYMTVTDKKRLKMYCLSNDTTMTKVLNNIINDLLKSTNF